MPHVADQPATSAPCPDCGYDRRAVADAPCPECGCEVPPVLSARGEALRYRAGVHRLAIVFVLLTFCLIMLGGTVTSKGAGLAVPDWPTTYDQNMFTFHPKHWVGNIFWEHTHRLLGALVGMVSIAVAFTLLFTQRKTRPWLVWFGFGTLLLIIVQGVMGGLRVTELSISLAVLHGINGQLVLCATVLIAAATSRWWLTRHATRESASPLLASQAARRLRLAAMVFFAVALIQLTLGSAMRHTSSGLAIPDFPTMYGGAWPPLTEEGIQASMGEFAHDAAGFEFHDAQFTPAQVGVHLAHRLWAVAVLGFGVWLFVVARSLRRAGIDEPRLRRPASLIGGLLLVQVTLGATVIWSARHPELATAHQSLGAAILALSWLLAARSQAWCAVHANRDAASRRGRAASRLAASNEGGMADMADMAWPSLGGSRGRHGVHRKGAQA